MPSLWEKSNLMPIKWRRPEARNIKLNVDAAYHDDVKAGAIGAVLHNCNGEFIAASVSYLPNVASPLLAEAYAMKEGLSLAMHMGYNMIVAESDSMEVVEACSGAETWWSEAAAIFADCVNRVASIGTVSFHHTLREANQVAHELAKNSFSNKSTCNWIDEPPDFILDKLLNDVTVI
jgi:ribonuclease HI